MTQHLHNKPVRKLPRAHRQGRQVLDLRARVSAISWLGWRIKWRNGRVYWQSGDHTLFAPTQADFTQAQYHLVKIARYRAAADVLLGNSAAWVEQRQQQLRLAQLLCSLITVDLEQLVEQARDGEPQAVLRLVNMLVVEALCVNRLPVSPAATLVACGRRVVAPLSMFAADDAIPVPARLLAALVLGALRRDGNMLAANEPQPMIPALRRAFLWSVRHGLPADPGLAAILLNEPEGSVLAERVLLSSRTSYSFRLPTKLMRDLLANGVGISQLSVLDEAATAADKMVDLRRLYCSGRVLRAYRQYVRETVDPQVISLIAQFVNVTLSLSNQVDLTPLVSAVVEQGLKRPVASRQIHLGNKLQLHSLLPAPGDTIRVVLTDGLSLPTSMYRSFLALVIEQHHQIWDREWLANKQSARRISSWMLGCWSSRGKALLHLLRMTNDAVLVRDAVEQQVYSELSQYDWSRLALRPWMLVVVRLLSSHDRRWQFHALWRTLQRFSNTETAHAVVRPFTDALVAAPVELRADLLYRLLDELLDQEANIRDSLPRLMPYMPQIIQLARTTKDAALCGSVVPGLLMLDTSHAAQADEWMRWLVSFIGELWQQRGEGGVDAESTELGVLLAAALADDLRSFQAVGRVSISYTFDQQWRQRQQIRQGIGLLGRVPAVCIPLRTLFPQQPKRCIELLMRLGMAGRLGAEALQPLQELDPFFDNEYAELAKYVLPDLVASDDEGWCQLLTLAPDLAVTAGSYVYTQWLRGDSVSVPAGVRRAMEQPHKMTRELAHIERLVAHNPSRNDLVSRAANLRERLADMPALLASVGDEVRERLRQITAEAQLAAAELQLTTCYRNRLRTVVGPLPAELVFDDDLQNATLLTVDVENNRRLLRRLLVAHVAGDGEWRERIPGNAAFLRNLAERGVDCKEWLGDHQRRYRSRHVIGGYLKLHMEREPIRILQMGNYVDTCLSRGGINSFSTVTNACELNKRVIYAVDANGRVVGRKLIAVSEDWLLVGFPTYTALDNEESSAAVGRILQRYVERFAAACGLHLAGYGEVPKLFAEEWYDDGVVEWDNVTQVSRSSMAATVTA